MIYSNANNSTKLKNIIKGIHLYLNTLRNLLIAKEIITKDEFDEQLIAVAKDMTDSCINCKNDNHTFEIRGKKLYLKCPDCDFIYLIAEL